MSNPALLSFDSFFRYERIALKGHVGFHLANPPFTLSLTVAHNLGYKPFFRATYGFGDGKYFQAFAGVTSYNLDGNSFQFDNIHADATNLYFDMSNQDFTPGLVIDGTIYYRIYAEPQAA